MTFRGRGHGDKLSRKGEAAIVALLERGTVKAAAAAVGINESTLKRWLREPRFAAEYRAARVQGIEQWVAAASRLGVLAVQNLAQILHPNSNARHSDKVMAARAMLEYTLRGNEALSAIPPAEVRDGPEHIMTAKEALECWAATTGVRPPERMSGGHAA